MRTIQTEELLNAIYQRRAVRKYTNEPIDAALVEELIAAASQAPSAMNRQPWEFVVIEGGERLQKFSDRIKAETLDAPDLDPSLKQVLAAEANVFHGAPYLIVICATSDDQQAAEDCALAAQNFMLAAFSYGLGTCPIGLSRPWLSLPETKRELGIPDDWFPVFPVVLGVPGERPESHGRRAPRILWL